MSKKSKIFSRKVNLISIFLFSFLISIVSSSPNKFQKECLHEHNKYREKHGVQPLKLNEEICKTASDWANHLAKTNTFTHKQNNNNGENLYMSSGKIENGKSAVRSWYDEIKDYNYKKPEFSIKTGHFTQVIWKNSKELCCAMVTKNKKTWIVAHYNPPGNYEGQFEENVLPFLK